MKWMFVMQQEITETFYSYPATREKRKKTEKDIGTLHLSSFYVLGDWVVYKEQRFISSSFRE